MEEKIEQATWQILRAVRKQIGPVVGLLVCFPSSVVHIAAFLRGEHIDSLVFGIYPPEAFFLGIGIPLFIASVLFAPFVWELVFEAGKEAIRRRRKQSGEQAIKVLLRYREAFEEPQRSPRYLSEIDVIEKQLKKLNLRAESCNSMEDLYEHTGALFPYLENLGLRKTQKIVRGWPIRR